MLLERYEPGVIEFDLAPFNQLPCACVVGSFLNRIVDIADWDLVLDFVVKNRLERADNLRQVETLAYTFVVNENDCWPLTTTPPMSKRIAFGGLDGPDMFVKEATKCQA